MQTLEMNLRLSLAASLDQQRPLRSNAAMLEVIDQPNPEAKRHATIRLLNDSEDDACALVENRREKSQWLRPQQGASAGSKTASSEHRIWRRTR
jgi:hypothetical protein